MDMGMDWYLIRTEDIYAQQYKDYMKRLLQLRILRQLKTKEK
jgi:hypothetical protein